MSHSASKTQEAPIETIEVQDQPAARATSKVTVTPKPEPLIVKSGESKKKKQADLAPPSINMSGNNSDAAIANLIPTNVPLPAPVPGTIRISQGVSQGLLVKKVAPVYPSMAQHLHREGTVQLLATIDKYGEIKKIRVLSGDAMLAKAASDAVQQWHYRPYLLNGQPVEIETQVTIVFKAPQ
jgi:protein TonB